MSAKLREEWLTILASQKALSLNGRKISAKPDLQTIPVLATFFGVTIDELLGYLPQLSKDEIQKLYWTIPIPLPYQILIKR